MWFTENELGSTEQISEGVVTLGQEEAIKPLDKRAINFLINEYLLLQNYKLTSVTFSEENENQVIYFISGFYKYQNYCQIHRIPMKMWYIFHPNHPDFSTPIQEVNTRYERKCLRIVSNYSDLGLIIDIGRFSQW